MDIEEIWIYIYFFAWTLTLFFYIKKYKRYDAISFLYSTYVLYALFSLFVFNSNEYNFQQITLLPFIYLFISLFITSYPIREYSVSIINKIIGPSKFLLLIVCIFTIVSSLIYFPSTISKFTDGIFLIIVSDGGSELYNESAAEAEFSGTGGITNIFAIFSEAFSTISILFLFYILTRRKYNKLILIGLVLSVLSGLMSNISMGQRSGVFMRIMTLLITYFAFKRFLPNKINIIAKKSLIVLSFIILIPIVFLTISRFSISGSDPLQSTYYYMGQENLYFNTNGLDNNGLRYGDRTFPLFKKMMGFENVPNNYVQRRAKYPKLKINDEVFVTYIGDFTLDFGPIVAMSIFIIFSLWATYKLIVRNKIIYFSQLILLHFCLVMCVQGGMYLFSFGDIAGNLKIIVYIIIYLWSKIDNQKKLVNIY